MKEAIDTDLRNGWLFCTVIVWLVAFSGTLIMKKIRSESWVLYAVYVTIVSLLFTIFAIIHII